MKYFILPLLLFFALHTQAQKIIYVNDDAAAGAHDGTSWANAYTDLQTAVDAAVAGDTIFVAGGTYLLINTTLSLDKDIKLFGSFAGTEAGPGERDFSAGDTSILKGDGSHTVISTVKLTAAAVIDGFKITGGKGDMALMGGSLYSLGGGMYNDSSSLMISNCVFSGNSADDYGGGMFNEESSPTITNCIFSGNASGYEGAGMFNDKDNFGSFPTITNCTFSGNSADNSGGGMQNKNCSPVITNCTFRENTAGIDGFGGGIYNVASYPIVTNCSFSGNSADYGGGIANSGDNGDRLSVTNCIFSGNKAVRQGGGMYNYGDFSPVIINCTFSGNDCSDGSGGGGIYNRTTSPEITNCIIYGNSSGIYSYDANSNPVITYSLVQGMEAIGVRNLDGDTDPQFENAPAAGTAPFTGGDYHLRLTSPVMNAGLNSALPDGIVTDLDGSRRIDGDTVELGAYEANVADDPPTLDHGSDRAVYTNESVLPLNREIRILDDDKSPIDSATVSITTGYHDAVDALQLDNDGAAFGMIEASFDDATGTLTLTSPDGPSTLAQWQRALQAVAYYNSADNPDNGYRVVSFQVFDGENASNTAQETIIITDDPGTAHLVIYVDGDASGSNTGATWQDAYTDLKTAIDNAASGDEIWVAGGGYSPPSNSSFEISQDVKLYGGFAGTEANLGARDLSAGHISILTAHDTSVIRTSDLTSAAVLDGFTITGAKVWNGGAIYNDHSSPLITNCIFQEDTASNLGGAIYNDDSSPLITNCTFWKNTASGGGAIGNRSSCSPVITNCTFWGNKASTIGGAIINLLACSSVITNCTFWGNTAPLSGGTVFNANSTMPVVITNCIIYGNSGGIVNNSASPVVTYSLVQGQGADATNLAGDTNPLFMNAAAGNFHIAPNSPVVNKGNNTAIDTLPISTDLDGHARIGGGTVDMGAYESLTVLYVDDDAAGAKDGSDWKDAYTDLQKAIDTAYAYSIGTIFVAGGEYKPAAEPFTMKEGIKLYGSFAGTEKSLGERDLTAGDTSLLEGNSSSVIQTSGLTSATVLDGFTITGGSASENGGGMYNYNSSPTIAHCTFLGNKADMRGGGGMYNYNSSPVITHCTFSGNKAPNGAGMENEYHSSPVITDCTFGENTASGRGGGMSNYDYSSPVITNCTFRENKGNSTGGAMYNTSNSLPVVTNCTFWGDTATLGGAIYNEGSLSQLITNCIIYGNSSGIGGSGNSTITYSLVQGMGADATNHNLDGNSDPGFVDAAAGDFHLSTSSPAIDRGQNGSLPATITTDLGDNPRIYKKDEGGIVDMGAYESSYSPPILTAAGNTTAYTENGGPAVVDNSITVTDLDALLPDSGWVRISSHYETGEDTLVFNNDDPSYGSIATASFDDTTGLLTLHLSTGGTATPAQWQAALRAVTYSNVSDSPHTSNRMVEFSVVDEGGLYSDTVSKTITITAVNDAPVLTAGSGTPAFTEGDNEPSGSVVIDSSMTVSDADNATLDSAIVSITGDLKSSEDRLLFNNDGATMGDITATYDETNGVLTLSSDTGASAAQWQAALRAVAYGNNSESPDESDRMVSFKIKDSTAYSTAVTQTVTVTAVNDVPVLTAGSGSPAFTEGDNEPSDSVVIDGGITVSDADGTTFQSATVKITGNLQSSEDKLLFNNDGITMGDIAASYDMAGGILSLTSDGGATLAEWTAALQSVAYTNLSEAPDTSDRIISFRISDSTDTSAAATKTVTVDAVDDAPVITSNGGGATASVSVAENAKAVTTVTATDADAGTLTYSLSGGADQTKFSIDATTGDLTFNAAPDYENPADADADNKYEVTVQVSDGEKTDDQTITVTVTNENDNTPVVTSNSGGTTASISMAENATSVTTVTATDADGETLTCKITGGTDEAQFSIDASTGALTFVAAPDYENPADADADNKYEVTVQVSDGEKTDDQTITVTVTNENDNTPVITSDNGGTTASVSVVENTTAVTTVTATDADEETLTYSLSGGADQTKFNIDATTGELTFNAAPDYENPGNADHIYEVTVQVSDGAKTEHQDITVTVRDENDVTPVITASQSFTVDESSADGTKAGSVVATDGDGTATAYQDWTIVSGNTDDAFKIDAATGGITVNNGPKLDYETKSLYTLTLTVSDGVHTSAPETVTIQLNDQPEAPTGVSLTPVTFYENQPAGTPAATLSSTAQDAGVTFTYTLVTGEGDANNSLFTISGTMLKTAAVLNYEQKNTYDIRVRSTTQYGRFLEKAFTIHISDVNEAPTLDAIPDQTICYTTAPQEISLQGLTAGEDDGQTTSITVSADNTAMFESLESSGGKLQYSIKEGAAGTAEVTITVTDDGGTANGGINTISRSFTLTVNPLPVVTVTSDIGTDLSKGMIAHLTATGGATYEWTAADGILNGLSDAVLTVRPAQDATYQVTVTSAEGCSAEGEMALTVKDDYATLSANNVFTPNGDGWNDTWKIPNLDMYPDNEVSIYDRAGRLIFQKKNYQNDWRGTLNGYPLPMGTYYYIVKVDSGKKIFKGYITLFRNN